MQAGKTKSSKKNKTIYKTNLPVKWILGIKTCQHFQAKIKRCNTSLHWYPGLWGFQLNGGWRRRGPIIHVRCHDCAIFWRLNNLLHRVVTICGQRKAHIRIKGTQGFTGCKLFQGLHLKKTKRVNTKPLMLEDQRQEKITELYVCDYLQ